MENGLSLRLFGSFEAYSNGQMLVISTKKARWLLALLALRAGKDVDRDWLCSLLWPDSDSKQGRYNLRRCLSDLRSELKAAGHHIVSDNYQTVRLTIAGVTSDILTFDQLTSRRDTDSLERAISLYRGPLLEECSEEWVLDERASREQRYLDTLETLADLYGSHGASSEVIRCLRLFLKRSSYSESSVQKLMTTLAQVGDIAEVSHTYTEFRNYLRSHLGAAPSVETTTLWEKLISETVSDIAVTQKTNITVPVATTIPLPRPLESGYIPRLLTPLIGREEETDAIITAVNRSPLVTLIGPGGVGKTSLALAVGKQIQAKFPDGIWFIDLASVTREDGVLPTFLQSLGRRCSPNCSDLEIVQEFLRPRQSLLVLDNCEHLTQTISHLTKSLLEHCPLLKVLATSRHPLGISGEQRFAVHPLSIPPSTLFSRTSPSGFEEKNMAGLMMEYPSVRLFVERVRQVRPQIALTNENALLAAQICVQLEGLPLALELAAARVSVLPMSQIASRLEDRFRLIMGNESTKRSRHETLRALLDWSYELLTPIEQVLFQRLAVFTGGASLEAIEAICISQNQSPTDVLDILTTLTDKSLVRFQENNAVARYRLLEMVREYAHEKLEDAQEINRIKDRHFRYFLEFTRRSWELPLQEGIQSLDREYDNVRAALDYSLNKTNTGQDTLDMVSALQQLWEVRGYLTEARKYLQQALSLPGAEVPSPSRVQALRVRANFERLSGHLEAALDLHQESLSLARQLGLSDQSQPLRA